MTQRKRLLIVDDEPENRTALSEIFGPDFEVHTANDGLEALDKAGELRPDMILLDIMMPRMDGFQTCLKLRQGDTTKNIPIIFLTSKNQPESETFGLELGADDFVGKPFNREVLKARVNKRLGGASRDPLGEFTDLEDCRVYWERQEAACGEERIPLTAKEIGLLRLFVENKGRLLTRNMILDKVWSDTYITDRTIDSHVKELRKKLPPMARLLKTIYGSGYRLDI
ncbi:MAG TPA: response regulator transcription factor [bacterium]|jgi:two-component system alkaline phosphatase synthesis response regulator PhoP